ncbi:hypothetical protein B0H13DRAFT_2470033 [Mycena leptocephala]|nr:hypothetical protein B0H13DRAFT_2470033 [Mycena leptocephala]
MLSVLEADRARIAELEAQISHLERSLSALRIEKMLAQERLDSYKYPVLELPNEIVSDVFMHFLPPYPLFPPLIGLLSPTLLTQICGRWREIALGTPALWRAISSYHESIHIPYDLAIHAFDTWLRSRQLEVLAAVAFHRSRWEHLELCLRESHAVLDGPMPLLRYLDLRLIESSAHATEAVSCHEMPLLRTVVLNYNAASSVILPWAQLMSLTLLGLYPSECVPILQQTSSLIRFKLLLPDLGFDGLEPDIALPCLESFTAFRPPLDRPLSPLVQLWPYLSTPCQTLSMGVDRGLWTHRLLALDLHHPIAISPFSLSWNYINRLGRQSTLSFLLLLFHPNLDWHWSDREPGHSDWYLPDESSDNWTRLCTHDGRRSPVKDISSCCLDAGPPGFGGRSRLLAKSTSSAAISYTSLHGNDLKWLTIELKFAKGSAFYNSRRITKIRDLGALLRLKLRVRLRRSYAARAHHGSLKPQQLRPILANSARSQDDDASALYPEIDGIPRQ